MSDNILTVENLVVEFRAKSGSLHRAANNVTFAVREGETAALVGESGSGKTTLLRAVLSLVKKSSGRVTLFGRNTDEFSVAELTAARRKCGYIPQDPYGAIPPGLSVLEAVIEPAYIAEKDFKRSNAKARAEALLTEFGLTEARIKTSRAVSLSGGQRQRVEIARALMLEPRLLLCDEPTSMQDVSTRSDILDALKKRVYAGMSIVFVTHDLLLAANMADRITVMKEGKVCESGSARELLASPKHSYTKALLNAIPRL